MTVDQPLFDPNATGVFGDRFAGPDITPARPTTFALDGAPFVRLTLHGIYGTLTIGPCTVPIRLSPPVDGMATIDVGPGPLTLGALSSAARSELAPAAAADPLAIVPASLAAAVGGAVVSHVRVRVDLTPRRLTAVGFDVIGDQPWTLLPGRLAVTDLNLSVNMHSHGADGIAVSGALTGTLTLGGTDVPVVASPVIRDPAATGGSALSSDARAPDPDGTAEAVAGQHRGPIGADAGWLVVMDSVDGVPLSSLRDLAGLLGDDGIDSLRTPAQTTASTLAGPAAPPRDSPLDPARPTPPSLTGIAIDLAPSGIVDAVTVTLDLASIAAPHSGADGSTRRTVLVDRRHRAERVSPVVAVTTEGREHRGPPAS